MDAWDQDFVDLVVPGHFTIRKDGTGCFQFGAVQGEMDCRIEKASDGPVLTRGTFGKEFFATFSSFIRKPGVGMALAFILLYRFDEAQLSKVISPFLLDARAAGGLGLTTSQVGLAYGTFGILALTCGGLLGGFLAAKRGLKTMLPLMVCSMYLPKLAFIFLSLRQPENSSSPAARSPSSNSATALASPQGAFKKATQRR